MAIHCHWWNDAQILHPGFGGGCDRGNQNGLRVWVFHDGGQTYTMESSTRRHHISLAAIHGWNSAFDMRRSITNLAPCHTGAPWVSVHRTFVVALMGRRATFNAPKGTDDFYDKEAILPLRMAMELGTFGNQLHQGLWIFPRLGADRSKCGVRTIARHVAGTSVVSPNHHAQRSQQPRLRSTQILQQSSFPRLAHMEKSM